MCEYRAPKPTELANNEQRTPRKHIAGVPPLKLLPALVAPALLASAALAQTAFPETEPNNTKATANVIDAGGAGLAPGDSITGLPTGSSTTTAGNASADYFLIKTAPAPLAIYRHRIVITTVGT